MYKSVVVNKSSLTLCSFDRYLNNTFLLCEPFMYSFNTYIYIFLFLHFSVLICTSGVPSDLSSINCDCIDKRDLGPASLIKGSFAARFFSKSQR